MSSSTASVVLPVASTGSVRSPSSVISTVTVSRGFSVFMKNTSNTMSFSTKLMLRPKYVPAMSKYICMSLPSIAKPADMVAVSWVSSSVISISKPMSMLSGPW